MVAAPSDICARFVDHRCRPVAQSMATISLVPRPKFALPTRSVAVAYEDGRSTTEPYTTPSALPNWFPEVGMADACIDGEVSRSGRSKSANKL